jgi:hypothetical protein
MGKPTSYDLLKDINESIFRLESKVDKRIGCIEDDIEVIKDWKSNLTGKISILAVIAGAITGTVTSVLTAFITKRL